MPATSMNHFTVLTDDVDGTVAFYGRASGTSCRRSSEFRFPGCMALCRRIGDPAHRRWAPARRASRRRDRSHGLHRSRSRGNARGAREERHRAYLPAAGELGNVAGVLLRSERRACRARFRRWRIADARRCGLSVSTQSGAKLDHLIVAAATLEQAEAFITERTGATPLRGGKHVAMGTHNSLLRLGERIYLELIAIDPDAPAPGRRALVRARPTDHAGAAARFAAPGRVGRALRRHRGRTRGVSGRPGCDSSHAARHAVVAHHHSRATAGCPKAACCRR